MQHKDAAGTYSQCTAMTPVYKQKAHYPLGDVQQAFMEGRYYPSTSASESMTLEEMSFEELVEHVCELRRSDCTQSQTHNSDNKVWIDSYTFTRDDGTLWYMKVHPAFDGSGRYFLMRLHLSDQQ